MGQLVQAPNSKEQALNSLSSDLTLVS
jgi:hypothetical protein